MTEQTLQSKKAYNLMVTPKGEINTAPAANGTRKIRFRGIFSSQGQTRERTFVAMGKAADEIGDLVAAGREIGLRGLFERMPANDGSRGAEYVSVVGLPRETQQAA